MSRREENDYDRQFQADLQRAIALSLETSEYEKFRNEKRQNYSESTETDNISKNFGDNHLKSRPRPESIVKSNYALPPPPSASKKNSSCSSSVNDLITFNSPKDENKSTVIDKIEDLKSLEVLKTNLFDPKKNNALSLFPDNKPSCSYPTGLGKLEKHSNTEVGYSIPGSQNILFHNNSSFNFHTEVTDFFYTFNNREPQNCIQYYKPQITDGLNGSFPKKAEPSQTSLDVLKVVSKQPNNNLIDLMPFNLSNIKQCSSERSSVLEEFDPLLDNKSIKNLDGVGTKKAEVPMNESTDGAKNNKNEECDSKSGRECLESIEDNDSEEADYEDAQSVCSGSFYDTFDPFDYMYTPSVDGSVGEPIYTTASVSKLEMAPLSINAPCGGRKSIYETAGLKKLKLFENIIKKKAVLLNSDTLAFFEMVKNLRQQFVYTDSYTNVGLVISPTIESNYTAVTSIKLVVHSANHQQPISFTCDLSSSVEHVIIQVICSFEGDIVGSVADYVLKVYGLSEYLTSETCLGDYEYVHQCIKLEKDVVLCIMHISDLKRPLARNARDDNIAKNLSIEDLLPNESILPITYDTLKILLETIEREMDNIIEAAQKIFSNSGQHSVVQPLHVQQAIKAVCALMGHVETIEISDSLNCFMQLCSNLTSNTYFDDLKTKVTSDEGDYSIIQLGDSSARCLKENLLLQCDKIRDAVRGLIESYCHAFNVDFQLNVAKEQPLGVITDLFRCLKNEVGALFTKENGYLKARFHSRKFCNGTKPILEFQDTILVHIGSLHRLQSNWMHTAYSVSVQIYHGTRVLKGSSCITEIMRPTTSFYNRVVFDSWLNLRGTTIACLPRESRLVLTLFGLTLLPPDHEQSRANPGQPQYEQVELGWSAIQFFDYQGILTQGSFLLSLWPPIADKRFSPAPVAGSHPLANHPVLYISLPDYGGTVSFPALPDNAKAPVCDFFSLDVNTQQLLINIAEQDSYAKAKNADREVLWEKRHYLYNIPQALPKVLLATQNWDFASLSDLHAMVHRWNPMEPLAALQLLLPCFPDMEVRSVAISWIKELGSDELVDYLPQLVQALKHETYDASPLAKFLLERALTSPRVAHNLYWLLIQTLPGPSPQNSSEFISNDESSIASYRYHRRLQIMLRALLTISGETMVQRFMSQQLLVKNLYEVAENVKKTKESLRLKCLQTGLEALHHSLQESSTPLPLSPSVCVDGIQVRTSSYFPSNTLPLKINFISDESKIFPAIFKVGDYLQQDMLTMQVIRIMDKMWLKEGLDLKMITFTCLPTGFKRGMIELVESAETLRKIQVEHGLTGSFKDRPIAEWLGKHNPSTLEYERAVRNFTASCAGYSVATYILGICDRHNDNIMLKTSGHLFHIDFGKFLGDAQMFGNFKRDRSPFVLTSDMAYVINGGDKPSQKFHHFVDLCCRAFCIVRKHGNIILNLFGLMVSSGIPGVTSDAVLYVQRALLPEKSDPEASAIFARMIDSSLKSWFTQLNFFLHNLSQLRFTGDHNDGELLSFIPKRYTCEEEGRILHVKVHGVQKRYDSEKYYIYILKVDRENQPNSTYLFRKYREFVEFHQKLCTMFPLAKCYSLPSGIQIGRSNTQQVAEKRKIDIEKFLISLFKMADEIAHSDIVYTFFHPLLRDEEEEVDINKKKVKGRKPTYENESHVIKGQLKLSVHYKRDTLMVMVHHARGLPKLAAGQEPSTYVKVYLKPDQNKSTKRKTKVVKKNCHPTFMEMLEYRLPLELIRERTLEATIWSHDTLQENEFLGGIRLSLCNFPLDTETSECSEKHINMRTDSEESLVNHDSYQNNANTNTETSLNRKGKSKGWKTFQVKGTHDRSYLDLSQLRLNEMESSGENLDNRKKRNLSDSSSGDLTMDISQISGLEPTKPYSPTNLHYESHISSKTMLRDATYFAKHYRTPSIFEGKYRMKSASEIKIHEEKPPGFSQISLISSKHSESYFSFHPKWKFVLDFAGPLSYLKKRGYYSEVVSPLLRPERILAARHKEMEEMQRRYTMEMEAEGEDERYIEGIPGEYAKTPDRAAEKDLIKDWPPIYKVLNPEPALAEFKIPTVYKEPSLMAKGRMPKYAPHLENVPTTTMSRNFLQPEENWVVYDSEPNVAFPVKAFKPKCYILHNSEPGTLPRKVFVERKRRLYISQNVEEILTKHGISDDDLLPPTSKSDAQFSFYDSSSFLPLESFDDDGFDPCSVEDWLELGKVDGVQHPIPAVAFVPLPMSLLKKLEIGPASYRYTNKESRKLTALAKEKKLQNLSDRSQHYLWMDVAVTNFNYKIQKWAILTLDGSQTKMFLPRIYVMFRAEDPLNFTYRVMDAVIRRRDTERLIKFNIYCDCMPLTGLPDIDEEAMKRISKSVTRNGIIREKEDILNLLESDYRSAHKRNLAVMSFINVIQKYSDMFSFIYIPKTETMKVPDKCLKDTGMEDFHGIKNILKRSWIYVIDETYFGMMHVVTACQKLNTMNFFTGNFGKHVSLEQFESLQNSYSNTLIQYLRNEWVGMVVTNVRMCLQDVGKGWFNIKEKSWPIYELSKLCRFMELIKFRMQTALKFLVETSTDLLLKIIEAPSQSCSEVKEDFVWGPDLATSKFKSTGVPVFTLVLKLDNTSPFYSTPPDFFEETLIKLYDGAIIVSHSIHQIQSYLLLNLRFPELFLSSVGLLDPVLSAKRERLRTSINKSIIPLKAYAKEYQKYVELFSLDIYIYVAKFAATHPTANDVRDEILKHLKDKDELESEIPNSIAIGPFYIKTEFIKTTLIDKKQLLADQLVFYLAEKLKNQVLELAEEFEALKSRIMERPTSIENVFEIREWLETVPTTVKGFDESIKHILLEYEILDIFWFNLENEDFENKIELMAWPGKIYALIDEVLEILVEDTQHFYRIQQSDEAVLWDKFDWCVAEVNNLMQVSDIAKVHETAIHVRKVWKTLKEIQELSVLLLSRQKLFGVPITSFEPLTRLVKDFTPYKDLWLTASDWLKYYEIWMDNPLPTVEGEGIERLHGDLFKTMQKCQRIFAEVPANLQVATAIKEDIDNFRPYIPLILALRSPGMKDRHWQQLLKQTGLNIKITPNTTFKDWLAVGIQAQAEILIKISEIANKEHSIEIALDEMEKDWENIELDLQPYKETGTYILKVPDELIQMLEDHIVSTQQFSFSPFKGMYEQKIDEWEAKLRLISAVFDEWVECQKQWMYLEPIFSSEDITEQLPHESKKYSTMERTWRRIMKTALEIPKVIWYCPDKRLLEALKECNFLLEQVQKGLSEYLEAKRTVFPRLYFLSDDELLEILAQARNPLAVQPHLRKCFENIYKLNFESDLKITKMYSAEGESVNLLETMYPKGSVEYWLYLVEEAMKTTVRLTLGKALANLAEIERNKWVLSWPGQIVIAGCQTYWTAHVEDALTADKLHEYFQNMLRQLDDLRSLVKSPLKRVERQILSALIVIEVHARDVTQQIYESNVKNVNDFDWISQLRYYWVKDTDLKVRAVNAEFQYGYEYLGNSGRLVITPLTDRCYLTLTGALHLKFGGAPAGPAGTGKTETTKDLAKAMAIQCVVFNCSDQLDFMAMGKFFKGLASSGAWACFDEFNRIDIEVLSVIAQQVITIQKAQIQRLDRFMFEGVEISLKASCAVFITMNPGYAGRTELPDNLKALFRPVAMMVPNYALIAEISLFSFGFGDAKELAGKITTTFKLSSEQLSSQDHYDFGMRAVKTVIAVAGNLKRERPNMDERQIVLRSLRDVNVPKFLKDDLKLFNGIVSDLFPRMVEEVVDYGELEQSIRYCIKNILLEDVDDYVKKVIQLYETTVVRHGLMLVGPTGSGKTKCYEILKAAMTKLQGTPSPSGYPFEAVNTYVLNPKSITMGQLYGEFDLLTHEWTDGILPSLVRIGTAAENLEKHWYVFDGPVDAVWIENMNTVLDDNKKLCLTSGEIIKLTEAQTMMFEVADLAVASPATVSRCGMVYLEPEVLGLQPFVNCWFKRMPKAGEHLIPKISSAFQQYLFPALELLRSSLREIVASIDSAIVTSFLNQMDIRIRPLTNPDGKPLPPKPFLATLPHLVEPFVIYSLIWSVGVTCDNPSRIIFSNWLHEKISEFGHEPEIPREGLVYDYRLHDGGFSDPVEEGEPIPPRWIHWMAEMDAYVVPHDIKYSDIEVPTIDNVRNSWQLGLLLNSYFNVLSVGPTGTGKTLTIAAKLGRGMPKKFICDFIVFSARTSANQTQDLIDSKLDKRRRNVYGPPVTKRQIFFIDDLNMPALETYGAQPPIELIRQWMDFGGWYDRKEIGTFRSIIETNFIAAMGPPGGGRNPITPRLMRHFKYIAFTELEDSSKMTIFGAIVDSWMSRTIDLTEMTEQFVSETLIVYSTLLTEMLPTPAKTHYTFNLRDLSKVFQGVLMIDPSTIDTKAKLLNLWYHENCRVFQDRLVNDADRNWFDDLLRNFIVNKFQEDLTEVFDTDVVLYADCCNDSRNYERITEFNKLQMTLEESLEDYNGRTTAPMKLVLFLDAVSHVCRISRVIRQPLGNSLLLGMGGSGRQSLSKLAAHIAEIYLFQIELSKSYGMTDWRDDVKNLLLRSGVGNREAVFLFSDTQIKMESFLEDLNSILNSGDVPNIYASDELDKIYAAMRGPLQEAGLPTTKSNLFSIYCKTVRSNLHCVLTMSPIGEVFRARLRQFPALVNCCTIDWFFPWPESALESVALRFLKDISDLEVDNNVLTGIVLTCQFMHQSVVNMSIRYKEELGKHNYVTPTLYLELLSSYGYLLKKKKWELISAIKRLKTGLDKMQSTAEEVKVLEGELYLLKPHLEKAAKEAAEMIEKIAADTAVAEETKKKVAEEEAVAVKFKEEAQAISEDAQRDLSEALPALEAAEKSLQALNKGDIGEVKALKTPPLGVITVIETICIIKGIPPKKVPGPTFGSKINDYWEPGKKMMADAGQFLTSLLNFDKDSITEEIITKLDPYINNPDFQPAKIIKVSKACTSLCMWVHAMYKYYFINLVVAPKKAALKEANERLTAVQKVLDIAKAKMAEILKGLAKLQASLKETERKKGLLEANAKLCEDRMDRAFRLINGLADEKERWISTIDKYKEGLTNLVGDILISAAAIAYLAPFTDEFRRRLFVSWGQQMDTYEIPHTQKCTPVSVLGQPVLIRQWQIYGLPRDSLSVENGVFVANSKRWPLFIDPQGQANRWIRNMGKEHGMSVVKLSDKDLMRTLEASIRFGKPCLIENVGVDLDPALDPVLLRQLFRQAGTLVLKLGDTIIPYNNEFKLYLTTKLANPHYTPEVSIKVLLVNFALVPSGLQDQLLALVVMQERPDLEEARSMIVVSNAQMNQELLEIEDRILYKLSASQGSPVDDIDLIQTLEASKLKSEEIKQKVKAAETTQEEIDNTRAFYIPVANRAQILFFCLVDMANVDPMYQYSMDWFVNIFINSMANTPKADEIAVRIETINDYFTFSLYANVCRSLFEKHKLLFAFLVCIRILINQGDIRPEEYQFLLAGGIAKKSYENPSPNWISERSWIEITSLDNLPKFVELVETFPKNLEGFKKIFDSLEPHRETYPKPWNEKLDEFQKIIFLKCIRPDKVTNAMQDFLANNLGQNFIEPVTSDLPAMYKESTPFNPLIFVLSAGTDPAAELYKFADKMKMIKRFDTISLGQGQGPIAEKMMITALETGSWVYFQNCHLAPSWMPRLERLIENINPESVHKEFRLWLTSTPSPNFPVSVLQNGSKMTVEPPRGIKANLLKAYLSQVTEFTDFFHSEAPLVPIFKWLLFSLCLFHGVCLERRKFGPLGFNIPYEFTDGDLRICISQLHMFLLEYTDIPFKVLIYTAGQINYGGRVTDDWDRRCIMNLLSDYYHIKVCETNYTFDEKGFYYQLPSDTNLNEYLAYIRALPLNDDPSLFGLHSNADISCAQAETFKALNTLLSLQPKAASGESASQEEVTVGLAVKLSKKIPGPMDLEAAQAKYPVLYEESLNTVLIQEIIRYNKLLNVIHASLRDILKALKGLVVMSAKLEDMSLSLFNQKVPTMWSSKAYPSLKPLGAWVDDLIERIAFLKNWFDHGIPPVFWISGFYFPQAFLTGTLQNFARKYIISIDSISFSFQILKTPPKKRPEDGCVIHGLFIEGARFDRNISLMAESKPKELYTEMPHIWLIPKEHYIPPSTGLYECPVYKTLTRAGTLSTTGHSTNYVLAISIPTDKSQSHWIRRGVALFCALDY